MRPADAAEISADKPTAVRVTIAVTPLLLEPPPIHPYAQSKGGLRVSQCQKSSSPDTQVSGLFHFAGRADSRSPQRTGGVLSAIRSALRTTLLTNSIPSGFRLSAVSHRV